MYKVSETVLPIYINGQCPIIKTCSDVTLNLSSKDSKLIELSVYLWGLIAKVQKPPCELNKIQLVEYIKVP